MRACYVNLVDGLKSSWYSTVNTFNCIFAGGVMNTPALKTKLRPKPVAVVYIFIFLKFALNRNLYNASRRSLSHLLWCVLHDNFLIWLIEWSSCI